MSNKRMTASAMVLYVLEQHVDGLEFGELLKNVITLDTGKRLSLY